jgi:hypothetical protein
MPKTMRFEQKHYQLDYFVFSAHKTGTQTMKHRLTTNGIPTIHCHRLQNHSVKIEPGLFAEFLASNYLISKKTPQNA